MKSRLGQAVLPLLAALSLACSSSDAADHAVADAGTDSAVVDASQSAPDACSPLHGSYSVTITLNDPQSSRTVTAAVDANGDLAIAGLGVLSCPSSMATCRLRMDGCEAPGDPYTGSGGALEAADGGSCVYSVTYKYAWCTGTSTGGTQFLTLLLTPT